MKYSKVCPVCNHSYYRNSKTNELECGCKKIEVITSIRSDNYDENVERYGEHDDTCFVCGKRTKVDYLVHYTTDGCFTNEFDESKVPNSQGFFPIGKDCAKRLPKGFTVKV